MFPGPVTNIRVGYSTPSRYLNHIRVVTNSTIRYIILYNFVLNSSNFIVNFTVQNIKYRLQNVDRFKG